MGLDVTGRYRYPRPDQEWLSRNRTAVIEPNLPIVDAHHHLWEQHEQPYLLDAFQEDITDGDRIVATAFLEADCVLMENVRLEIMPGGSHSLHPQMHDAFCEILLPFLQQHSGKACHA